LYKECISNKERFHLALLANPVAHQRIINLTAKVAALAKEQKIILDAIITHLQK
jgi:hypothetical protein